MIKTRYKKETNKNFRISKINKKKVEKPIERDNDLINISLINLYSDLLEIYEPLESLHNNLVTSSEYKYHEIFNYLIFFNKSLTLFCEFLNYIKNNKYSRYEDLIKCLYIKYFKQFENHNIICFLIESQKGKILINDYSKKIKTIESNITNFDNEHLLNNELKVYLNSFEKILFIRKQKYLEISNENNHNIDNDYDIINEEENNSLNKDTNINDINTPVEKKLNDINPVKEEINNKSVIQQEEIEDKAPIFEINLLIDNLLGIDLKKEKVNFENLKNIYKKFNENLDKIFIDSTHLDYDKFLNLLNKSNYYKIITVESDKEISGMFMLEFINNYIIIQNLSFWNINIMKQALPKIISFLKSNYNFYFVEISLKHVLIDENKLKINKQFEGELKHLKFKWSKLQNLNNFERYTTFKYKNIDFKNDSIDGFGSNFLKYNEKIIIDFKNKLSDDEKKVILEDLVNNFINKSNIDSNLLVQFAFLKSTIYEKEDNNFENSFFKSLNTYEINGFSYEINNKNYNFNNNIVISKSFLVNNEDENHLKIIIDDNINSFISENSKYKIHLIKTNSNEIFTYIIELPEDYETLLKDTRICNLAQNILNEKVNILELNTENDSDSYILLKINPIEIFKFSAKNKIINNDNLTIDCENNFEFEKNIDFINIAEYNFENLKSNSKMNISNPYILGTIFSKMENEEKIGLPIFSILIK